MQFKGIEVFEENTDEGLKHRQNYVDGMNAFIKRKDYEAKSIRREFLNPQKLAENPEIYRKKFTDMLGLDKLTFNSLPSSESKYVGEDLLCQIYRITVFITPEIPFYGILLIPHGAKDAPLVICQHGGSGTPELLCSFNGTNSYGFAAQRLLQKGAAVLAPQLLLWSRKEIETARDYKVAYNRNEADTLLRRFGITLTGLEIKGIINSIDYCISLPQISNTKIGMAGLSYGGYYTIYTMAADTRIKAGYSAACFNDRGCYPWRDTNYFGSALTFQDAEVAALCAPRALYITIGKEDKVFDYKTALPEVERVYTYFEAYCKLQNFKFKLWDGGHNFPEDDEGFDFLLERIDENEK